MKGRDGDGSGSIEGAILPGSSISAIACSMGVTDLGSELADSLASEVEYRLRQVTQDALKFAQRCCRDKLKAADVNAALRLRNVESLYGFNHSSKTGFRKVEGYDNLFVVDENEMPLDQVLAQPLPPLPVDSTFSVHWLAIDGVQPLIPQNPPPEKPSGSGTDSLESPQAKKETIVKAPVRHVLSREQQMYFEHVATAIKSGDAELQKAVLHSLSTDAGLHQLLPYFTQFIADEVHHNLRNLPLLSALMKMTRALLVSPHMHVEPYLHQLMPPILTCLVGRALCMNASEDHWSLRDYSAAIIAHICRRFGECYQTLQPRITKTLAKAFLNPQRPLTTHYGAIVGLAELGTNVVRVLLLPHVQVYLQLLLPELASAGNPTKRMEAQQVFGALLHACGSYARAHLWPLRRKPLVKAAEDRQGSDESMDIDTDADKEVESIVESESRDKEVSVEELLDLYGEALLPYALSYNSSMALCFV